MEIEQIEITDLEALEKIPPTTLPNKPFAFIKLYESLLYVNIHCSCGASGKFNTKYLEFVRCTRCGNIYQITQYLALKKLELH